MQSLTQKYFSTSSNYRYSYNGKEKLDELSGAGNSYDYGARMYNPRIGRWFSCDPLQKVYTGISPYVFVLNTPLQAIDPDGKDVVFPTKESQNAGRIWLEELGLEDEFYINKGGKLRHQLSPFEKNDELTNQLKVKINSGDVYEVSYSPTQDWLIYFDDGTGESDVPYCGTGSCYIRAGVEQISLITTAKQVYAIVVTNQGDCGSDATQFLEILFGLETANEIRTKLSEPIVEISTVCRQTGIVKYCEEVGSGNIDERAINDFAGKRYGSKGNIVNDYSGFFNISGTRRSARMDAREQRQEERKNKRDERKVIREGRNKNSKKDKPLKFSKRPGKLKS